MTNKEIEKIKNEMEKTINIKIKCVNEIFKIHGWTNAHEGRIAEIDGMIEMLSIVTGKNYIFMNSLEEVAAQ